MNKNLLSIAIALVATGMVQNSFAATAVDSTSTPPAFPSASSAVVLNLAGSSAQDKAIQNVLALQVCSSQASLTIYKDSYATPANPTGTSNTSNWGGRWTSYVCTTGTTAQSGSALPAGLANKTIIVNKRSAGGSAYALLPIIDNDANGNAHFPVNFLDPAAAIASASSSAKIWKDTSTGITIYGLYANEPSPNIGGGTVAGTNTAQVIPDAGVTDTNPGLFSGTENTVPEFGQGVAQSDIDTLKVKSAAAFTFTVPVSTGLFNALQAAQGLSVSANYGHASGFDDYTPSLSSAQSAAIISGKVKNWGDLTFNGVSLTTAANNAGVTVPADTMVHYLRRTPGSGTAAQQYARFLNYPTSASAATPADDNKTNGGPAVSYMLETADEEAGFDDLANGTNIALAYTKAGAAISTGVNNSAKGWGIGQITADKNVISSGAYSHAYRHIKVDGYSPTLQNVFNGNYKDWAQSSWVYNPNWPAGTSTASQNLLTYFIQQATLGTTLKKANVTQDFGTQGVSNSGYLGLVENNGGVTPATLDYNNPVTPYTYPNGDNGATPVPAQGSTLSFK